LTSPLPISSGLSYGRTHLIDVDAQVLLFTVAIKHDCAESIVVCGKLDLVIIDSRTIDAAAASLYEAP
jgi:hypothetical protein